MGSVTVEVCCYTLEWNAQHVHSENLAGKVILELGSGSGFFLRRIYDALPEDAVYIAADHDPGKLRFLKGILEKAEKRKGVLFICCDFPQIPLKARSVDVLYDFTGTSNFSFEHREFLPRLVERFLKTEAELLGSYIIFRNFSPDSMVPIDFRPNFQIHSVKKQIEELGFIKKAEYTSDVVTKGGFAVRLASIQKSEWLNFTMFLTGRSIAVPISFQRITS